MKCGCYVLYKTVGKKYPKEKVAEWFPPFHPNNPEVIPTEARLCDGDIIATVELDSDGGCCCCSVTTFRMRYICNKCGWNHANWLPTHEDELGKWVTELIANIDREALVTRRRKIEETLAKLREENLKRHKRLLAHTRKLAKAKRKK